MTAAAPLALVPPAVEVEDRTRVCGISFFVDEAHEFACIRAIRAREHPAWSQYASSFRVAQVRRVWR